MGNSWLTQQDYENILNKYQQENQYIFSSFQPKDCRIRLLFPNRNADWTLQKKLYQGKEKGHNAVFSRKNVERKANYGFDNDLLYWPLNEKGYTTDGTIDKMNKYI